MPKVRRQYPLAGRILEIASAVAGLLAVSLLVIWTLNFVFSSATATIFDKLLLSIAVIALSLFAWRFGVQPLIDVGSRLRAIGAKEALAADSRPPIIYLRSFVSDRKISDAERALAANLRSVGPMIAIGRPDEILPRLGAFRLYVDDEHWQDAVKELLSRSSHVFLAAGSTPGLKWELEQCAKLLRPDRLAIIVPSDAHEFKTFAGYFVDATGIDISTCIVEYDATRVRKELAYRVASGFRSGAMESPINALVVFDSGWVPRMLPVQYPTDDVLKGLNKASWQSRFAQRIDDYISGAALPYAHPLGFLLQPRQSARVAPNAEIEEAALGLFRTARLVRFILMIASILYLLGYGIGHYGGFFQ